MTTSSSSQSIHFLGIAGIGVSALAQVALAQGKIVSGSDPKADPETNPAVARLAQGGARLFQKHRAANLAADVDLVVASAAISEQNPEIVEARQRGIRIVSRAEFLGEMMATHSGPTIAVAGTHGKTTTTAMIGVMLQHLGLDPTVFVGGEVPQLGGNVRIGSPEGPFVLEACEAYDSFLHFRADILVLTNIEADHLDHYGTFEEVQASFVRFCRNSVQRRPTLILCADDPVVFTLRETLSEGSRAVCLYGLENPEATLRGGQVTFAESGVAFDVLEPETAHVALRVPGKHNALNALAACGVGQALGIALKRVAIGLAEFRGSKRRQELLGGSENILVVDDYAHHPTEIRAAIAALRMAYPERRLIAVFQPHLYSRTRDFLNQFAETLAQADALLVTDIYAAREAPLPGVRAADIVSGATRYNPGAPALFLPDKKDIPDRLLALSRPGDLVLVMGAGDIREQGEAFVRRLHERSKTK